MQPCPCPFHVMKDRVKQLMVMKIKFLWKVKLFHIWQHREPNQRAVLANGCIIYFRRKLEGTKLQIVCLLGMVFQCFFTVLSTRNREETFRRWERESTINFKTTLRVFNRAVMLYFVLKVMLYFVMLRFILNKLYLW